MRREWLLRLLLGGLGVGLALVIGAFGLRLLDLPVIFEQPAPCTPADGDWRVWLAELVGHYRDPCDSFYWDIYPTGEFYNLIRLNNFGLHDVDRTLEKAAGQYRLLVLGDSFTQAWQVPLDAVFTRLLEQQLQAASSRPVQVINAGVDDYGTGHQLMLYAALGWRFQPDVVLLAFYLGNDVKDNYRPLAGHQAAIYEVPAASFWLGDDGLLYLHNAPDLPPDRFEGAPAWDWLVQTARQSPAAPPLATPAAPRVIRQSPRELEYPVELGLYLPDDDDWRAAWALTEALILRLHDLVTAHGSRFGVLLIPDRRAVHPSDWDATTSLFPVVRGRSPLGPGDRLEALLARHGIPALNLTYTLSGWALAHPDERLYYLGDGHFNPNGHAVTAQRVGYWLQEIGYAP
jgi:lysophospholipase L1-like esterase